MPLTQCTCINIKRDCVLKALFVYLNEDPDNLSKEYMDADFSNAETALKEMVMGVFVFRCENEPADIGVFTPLNFCKVFLELDGHQLSTKVQALKTNFLHLKTITNCFCVK